MIFINVLCQAADFGFAEEEARGSSNDFACVA